MFAAGMGERCAAAAGFGAVTKIRRIPPRVWLTQAPLLTQRGPGAVTRSPHHDHPHPEVSTLKGLTTDLAGRYKFTASSGGSVDPALVEADIDDAHRKVLSLAR